MRRSSVSGRGEELKATTLEAISRALEVQGVELIGTSDDGPGACLR
jgi:DNA-binding Xre family transcriptional regulator